MYVIINCCVDPNHCIRKSNCIVLITDYLITIQKKFMSIIKVIELMSNSTKSWEDATQQAINEASKSVKNIKSVYVKDHCVLVENNKIKQYRVTVKLSFEIVEKTVLTKKK